MIKKILLLTTIFTSFNASALDTWDGYKPIEKVSAPHKAAAMATVVKIYTVTLLEKDADSYEVVDTDSTKKVTSRKKLDTDLRTLQIETCRNQGLKRCPIFKTSFNGTGFIDEGRSIYTCRHMVHNWATIAAKENGLKANQIFPAVRFTDNNKKPVYNSATSENLIKIAAMNPDPRLNYVLKEAQDPANSMLDRLYMQSEFIKLESDIDLLKAQSLSFSTDIRIGAQAYFSGFPTKTKIFGGGKGDTPGFIMVSSTGPITYSSNEYQLFITSAIVTSGMSGGMVTNENGEVIGIACSSDNDGDDASKKNSTSVMFNPDAQAKLWDILSQLNF